MVSAVFLDRDGVLIEDRANYVRQWSDIAILPGTINALSGLHSEGFKVVIVTNQAGIGRGLLTFQDATQINDRLIESIKARGGWVDATFICPHTREENCLCRKPLPGLLIQAARELSLTLESSWMVGDSWRDLLAGQSAGVRGTIMVRTGHGTEQLPHVPPEIIKPYIVCDDVLDACRQIISISKKDAMKKSGHRP